MNWLDFLILAVAAWRLAHFLVREDAPYRIMARFRLRWTFGGLLNCVKCTSVWTAALCYALWTTPAQPLVMIAAVSGAALMLSSFTGASHD